MKPKNATPRFMPTSDSDAALSPSELSWVLTLNVNVHAPESTLDVSASGATFSAPQNLSKWQRQQARLLSNRRSAHDSRQRKKSIMQTLENTVKELELQNADLLAQLKEATLENTMLKEGIASV